MGRKSAQGNQGRNAFFRQSMRHADMMEKAKKNGAFASMYDRMQEDHQKKDPAKDA